MHRGHGVAPRYTGHPYGHWDPHAHHPHPHHGHGGFCHSCCHPVSQCCCHMRECRKEAKELLVESTLTANDLKENARLAADFRVMDSVAKVVAASASGAGGEAKTNADEAKSAEAFSMFNLNSIRAAAIDPQLPIKFGLDRAFIGGGCCVHLSIEYVPIATTAVSLVGVFVTDSEGTALVWGKLAEQGSGYRICEGILTTKPGAHLVAVVLNMTARIRWCEVFSC